MIGEALLNRPDLLYYKTLLESNRLKLEIDKGKRQPMLSLLGTYQWQGDTFPGDEDSWAVQLNLSISLFNSTLSTYTSANKLYENPYSFRVEDDNYSTTGAKLSFFDGSSNDVTQARAAAEYRRSRNRVDQLKREIVMDVQNAETRVREANALLESGRQSIQILDEKLDILEQERALKEGAELDVLEARIDLAEAKVRNERALNEYAKAMADFYKSVGKQLRWKDEHGGE